VDSVPDPLLLRKSGSIENQIQPSGSVARNSDHQTIEAVQIKWDYKKKILTAHYTMLKSL
jgi:hypothetical protein